MTADGKPLRSFCFYSPHYRIPPKNLTSHAERVIMLYSPIRDDIMVPISLPLNE